MAEGKGNGGIRTIRLTKTPTGWRSAIQSEHGLTVIEELFSTEDEAFRESGEFLRLGYVR